jgi:hypothetical protein
MKIAILISTILILVTVGCERNNKSGSKNDGLIVVDITKTGYPKKELTLQDFMDVEYVVLETNDDFLNRGLVRDIGEKFILVDNRNRDGDIFIYDRKGKAIRKINRQGQGSEEYTSIYSIALDENNEEIFVNDIYLKKIIVYDLYGNFKRSLTHKEDEDAGSLFYINVFSYDRDNLICNDIYNKEVPFVLISKQDGSITKEIKIPFVEKKLLQVRSPEDANRVMMPDGASRSLIPFHGIWMFVEFSSDTVYTFLQDHSLRPHLVRTPPIQSMDPGVFLLLRLLSDRYFFMETIKNEFNFNTGRGFPRAFLMYDKQEKAMFNYVVYNGDYSTKQEIYMNWLRPVNHEIESWQPLEAHRLVDDYKAGRLKGKLKEIAAELDEEDNPVIMLIKHKK